MRTPDPSLARFSDGSSCHPRGSPPRNGSAPPADPLLPRATGRQARACYPRPPVLRSDTWGRSSRGAHRVRPCIYLQRPRSCPPAPTRRTAHVFLAKAPNSSCRNQPTHHPGQALSDQVAADRPAINAGEQPLFGAPPQRGRAALSRGRDHRSLARLRAHPHLLCLTGSIHRAGDAFTPLGRLPEAAGRCNPASHRTERSNDPVT